MAYEFWNEKELSKIELGIARGDAALQSQFYSEVKKVAKAANSRLLRLEKAGFTTSNAYERAIYYTSYNYGADRFRVNKSMDTDKLIEQYREMRTFMRKESSTVTGVKASRKRLINYLEDRDIHIRPEDRDKFFDFINSDDLQDAIEVVGFSEDIFRAISEYIDKKGISDIDKLGKQFQAFLNNEIFYDDLLERISGMTYEDLYKQSRGRNLSKKDRFKKL